MGSRISILLMTSSLVILRMLYKKLNYARISIDSHLWSNGGQTQRWRHHWQLFRVFIISTNRFCVVVGLYSNRSQKTWKCGCALYSGTFWRYPWSIGKQTHNNMESLFCRIYYQDRDAFFFFNEIQSKGNIGKRNRINWFIFRFGKILRNLSLKSFTQDEKFEVFPFLIYDAWNAVLSICEAWIFLNFVRETGSPFAILLPYLYEIISFFTLRLKIFLRKGEFLL